MTEFTITCNAEITALLFFREESDSLGKVLETLQQNYAKAIRAWLLTIHNVHDVHIRDFKVFMTDKKEETNEESDA